VTINLKQTKVQIMKMTLRSSIRSLSLAAIAAVGMIAATSPSQAQTAPAFINARLSPTRLAYVPNMVPSQCLAYAMPGQRPVVYCEGQPPTPFDVNVSLMYGGVKPWGWKTPDDCILRHGYTAVTGLLYCKTRHW
jgi:hypothetical protein